MRLSDAQRCVLRLMVEGWRLCTMLTADGSLVVWLAKRKSDADGGINVYVQTYHALWRTQLIEVDWEHAEYRVYRLTARGMKLAAACGGGTITDEDIAWAQAEARRLGIGSEGT